MITVTPTRILVRTPYEDVALREKVASIPGATWSKSARAWALPSSPMTAETITRVLNGQHIDTDSFKALGELLEIRRQQTLLATADPQPLPHATERPPWRHQLEAFWFALQLPAALLYHQMGAGKTRTAIEIIRARSYERVLVVAPKSAVRVWANQLYQHEGSMQHRSVFLDSGSVKKKRGEAALCWFDVTQRQNLVRIVVINYESVWRKPLAEYLMEYPPQLVICDEVHRIKSAGGSASKFMARLGRVVPHRIGLSGTPLPHSPLDAYGVFRFLDPGIFGTSFGRFRSRYAVVEEGSRRDGATYPVVIGWQNEADFRYRFDSITHRAKQEHLQDLPEVQHVQIEVDLPTKARKVYDSLKKEFLAEIEEGEITAANAAVKVLRLQQITSGFAKTEDGVEEGRIVDLHAEKSDALVDLLEDLPPTEPVVVFCRFTRDLDAVHEAAKKAGRFSCELSGRINHLGRWADVVTVLAVQIRAGAEGIDLTRAAYAVYYSIGYSLGEYEQSLARLHRPGQERPVTYYHLIARRTVDEHVYAALQKRRDVLTYLLEEMHA